MLEQLTELRETRTFSSLLKDVTKETEQPDEEIHRTRSGRVPHAGASVPVELGVSTSGYVDVSTNLEAPQIPYCWGFMEASSCGHDPLLTPFPAPLPSLENGGWGCRFQASNHGLVFLVTSAHPGAIQEPTQSHLSRTKGAPRALIT